MLAKARTYERGFPWFVFDMFTQYQEQGPDYIAAYLKGYEEPPKGFQLPARRPLQQVFPRPQHCDAAAASDTARSSMTTARRRRSTSIPRTSRRS